MTINNDEILNQIMDYISSMKHIKPEDIPNIELYMDQVTTFMNAQLESSKRYPEDKILTKTMINNYAKNHLLPAPNKKKYTKEHLLMLIFIYYFKSFLSMSDIQALLNPLSEHYFQGENTFNIEDIYQEVFSMEKEQLEYLKENIAKKYETAMHTFQDAPEKEKDFLQLFSFVTLLSYDVYVKKQIIEMIIDSFPSD